MTSEKIRILILAANPFVTGVLTLDEEYKRIHNQWRSCDLRDLFDVKQCQSTRANEIQSEVLAFKPNLIHFSGHGEADSLIFADATGYGKHEVRKQALADIFKLCTPNLKAVFLNACHSSINSEAITEQVDYFIGMKNAINDKAGIAFSDGFYAAIFNQNNLDIIKAFEAGCNQIAIDHTPESNYTPEAEQKKPVLQKRPQTYVPCYKYDIFIDFSEKDTEWSNTLITYLYKKLRQELNTADGFQILCSNDNLVQLENSATSLIIYSLSYYQQYFDNYEYLNKINEHRTVILAQYEGWKLLESLKGRPRYEFWCNDKTEGVIPLKGDAYFNKADELASEIVERLIKLRSKCLYQQNINREFTQGTAQYLKNTNSKISDSVVFLLNSREDTDLAKTILERLKESGIYKVLSLNYSDNLSSREIRLNIENHILSCDTVFILYDKSNSVWVREQLNTCQRLQHKRASPLKFIIVPQNKDNPNLSYLLENLYIINSLDPEKIAGLLFNFIEALK